MGRRHRGRAGDLNRGSAAGRALRGSTPAAMGASGSAPATPVPGSLRNRHLAHVSDPRSPSAGILRTPIEVRLFPLSSLLAALRGPSAPAVPPQVVSSPAGSPQPGPAQAGAQDADPRSPTPGIYRTPMKDTPSGECRAASPGLFPAWAERCPLPPQTAWSAWSGSSERPSPSRP